MIIALNMLNPILAKTLNKVFSRRQIFLLRVRFIDLKNSR